MGLAGLLNRLIGFDRLKNRADQFFLDGDFQRALREYRRAHTALGSSDYRAATVEGLIRECLIRLGDPPKQASRYSSEPDRADIEEAESSPNLFPGLGDLFELAIAGKRLERIREYRGLGEDFERGYVALVQGDGQRAASHLERAAGKNPSSFTVRLELGRALSLAGRMERAREELEKAHRLHPGEVEGVHLLAAVDIELRRFGEAAGLLETLAESDEAAPETFFLLGRSLVGLGRTDHALARFREAVQLDSRFHEAYYEAGKIMLGRGNHEGALALLSRACSLAPDEKAYNLELAKLVLEYGLDAEIGLGACDRLMVTDEENQWQYLAWIAELYLRRGWKREARDPLRKALNLIPADRIVDRLAVERRLAEIEDAYRS